MRAHKLWKWAMLREYNELARAACDEGARDFARCVGGSIDVEQCVGMWYACFAHIQKDNYMHSSPESRVYCGSPPPRSDEILCEWRAIIRGDRAIVSNIVMVFCMHASKETPLIIGEYAPDDLVRVAFDKSIASSLPWCYDFPVIIIKGVIRSGRGELAHELILLKLATDRRCDVHLLSRYLLRAKCIELHKVITPHLTKLDRVVAIEYAAQSGDRATCEYARKLWTQEFNFGRMLRGAAHAPGDAMCKLTLEWFERVRSRNGVIGNSEWLGEHQSCRARDFVEHGRFRCAIKGAHLEAMRAGNLAACARLGTMIVVDPDDIASAIESMPVRHAYWNIAALCGESREFVRSARFSKCMREGCPMCLAVAQHARDVERCDVILVTYNANA